MCCEEKAPCQKPGNLIDKPKNCSPAQIAKCHGSDSEHPCESPPRDMSKAMNA
ncbi:MAG: hypothetical protein HN350_11370 [Phycisphaerales bacterium]|nr:hypothetical protein [Phycisphaerales bacterium]